MASKFVVPVRDQPFMEFVSYHERLGDDHLVWTVIDVVEGLDLSLVHDRYAPDVGAGGRPAFDPAMMLSLLIFGYCEGKRSSRELEDACRRDWAYRAICGDLEPDHATIARFRVRLDDLLKGLFGQVLMVCANAGMIDVSVVAVDGTRMGSVASKEANRTITTLAEMEVAARCMLDEAAQADGNDPDLGLDADHDADPGSVSVTDVVTGPDPDVGLVLGLDTDHDPGSVGLDADHDPGPGSVSGSGRVSSVSRRRNEQVRRAGRVVEANQVVCDGEASRVAEETKRQKPKRLVANVTDPESRLQKTRRGFIQGYNAQAVVSADQVVIACDVTNNTTDQAQLEPMLGAAKTNVGAAGITVAIGSALADAGYASYTNFEAESRLGMSLLIATSRGAKIAKCDVERSDTERDSERIELFQRIEAGECTIAEAATTLGLSRSWVSQLLGRYRNHGDLASESMLAWREMTQRLAQPLNRDLYKQRGWMIEGSFAHTKTNRGIDTFTRHGLEPCRAEWTLINLAGNIKKLHKRHHTPTTRPTPPAEPADSPENGSSNGSAPDRCHPKRRPHQQHPTPSRCTRC